MPDDLTPRKKLIERIIDWNTNRLGLFELSMPAEDGEFNGVMRFFYQDELGRFQTKCIRVSSKQRSSELVEVLREKFFPLDSSIKHMHFGIYEHHASGVRRLTNDEFPLLVQLNWSKYDREGKFVMKVESSTRPLQFCNGTPCKGGVSSSKAFCNSTRRRWSLRRDRRTPTVSRRGPLGCAAAVGWNRDKSATHPDHFSPHEPSLNCLPSNHQLGSTKKSSSCAHSSPPDSTFTRTISNPEEVMRRKRQRTLEAKLMQILHHDVSDVGGTLKIYGGQICPSVPYKTLLLSATDSVSDVIRQGLNKYGLEDADPAAYCLVMRVRTSSDVANNRRGTEGVLCDTDFPLTQLFNSTLDAGTVVTFELRPRPPHLFANRPFSNASYVPRLPDPLVDASKKHTKYNRSSLELDTVFACLIELRSTPPMDPGSITFPDTHGISTGTIYPLPVHKGQVCVGTVCSPDAAHPYIVTLPACFWPGVELHHLIIWRPPVPPGITSAMAAAEATTRRGGWLACRPCMRLAPGTGKQMFAQVFVNNQPLVQTAENQACVYWLSPGDVIRLGSGRRCLKIWPGSGSLPLRLPSKINTSIATTGPGSASNCPEVPRHHRVYESNLSGSPPSTYENAPPLVSRIGDVSHMSTPVTFFSPLIHSPISHLPEFTRRPGPFVHTKSSLTFTPVPAAVDRISVSSSSLSSNPTTDELPSSPRPTSYERPIRSDIGTPAILTATKSSTRLLETGLSPIAPLHGRSFETGYTPSTSVSVHIEQIPPFRPIPSTTWTGNKLPTLSENKRTPGPVTTPAPNPPDPISNVPESVCSRFPSLSSSDIKPSMDSRSHRPRSGSTISDRLPCQLAFAPGTVALLLDWVIKHSLAAQFFPDDSTPPDLSTPPSSLAECPLGPAITVYLMLRAIHRQCDRWEIIEAKQLAKHSNSTEQSSTAPNNNPVESKTFSLNDPMHPSKIKLATHQLRRRRRELLILLAGAVERLEQVGTIFATSVERWHLWSPPVSGTDWETKFHTLLRSVAAWLSNASQLLHLVTRDVDFSKTFEIGSPLGVSNPDDDVSAQSTWAVVQDQLTDVVQTAFGFLTDICVSRLDRESIPNLLLKLTRLVENHSLASSLPNGDDGICSADESTKDPSTSDSDATLRMLTETLDSLHLALVNPAFVVQLFARLLHRLNARLFNFILGSPSDSTTTSPPDASAAHVSPSWGSVLQHWIHECLCVWAASQGLGVAAECYLQRVSQAADLMLADVSSVENLYNVVVDLAGLNSRQVGWLLSAYQRTETTADAQNSPVFRIPENWIGFVVSGVKLVADRILAEEETHLSADTTSEDERTWDPRLMEELDLLLPLLLPEDSYPSDNSIPFEASEDPTSCDSGISSRPSSSTDRGSRGLPPFTHCVVEPLILVESVRKFLTFALTAGWCRLSVRPICDRSPHGSSTQRLHWNVYLRPAGATSPVSSSNSPAPSSGIDGDTHPHNIAAPLRRASDHLIAPTPSTTVPENSPVTSETADPAMRPPSPVTTGVRVSSDTAGGDIGSTPSFDRACLVYISSLCSRHQPFTVIVPKIGRSLGLNIVAAKASRVHALCDQLFTELAIDQPEKRAPAASRTSQPTQAIHTTCDAALPSYQRTGDRTPTAELVAQLPYGTFAPRLGSTTSPEPVPFSVCTAAFTRTNEFGAVQEGPAPCRRTNPECSNARSSRSLGDLPSLNITDASMPELPAAPVERTSRRALSGRALQRRHTTVTTDRFNVGPRPEPPNQGPSIRG
ncbi:unnamed protein product [Dicrocoelium dendriticum]|nr:unnamed protein product [Dicrocoelium dendriticum]